MYVLRDLLFGIITMCPIEHESFLHHITYYNIITRKKKSLRTSFYKY